MESGPGPQSPREPFGPGSPGYGPGGASDEGRGPQSPAGDSPPGPQAPQPPDPDQPAPEQPESPAPEPPAPGPQAPQPAEGQLWAPPAGAAVPPPPAGGVPAAPQSPPPPPSGPQSPPPPPGGGQSPGYGGPVPPGGWQQPIARSQFDAAPGQLASWGSRVGALLLDGLFRLLVLGVGVGIASGLGAVNNAAGIVVGVIVVLGYIVAILFYGAYFMSRDGEHNGQTPGKQILGIRVVRDGGQPFDFGSAFVREFLVKQALFGFLGLFFFAIPTLLDYLWPLWDDSDRSLHDMLVTSHVVRH